MVPHNSWCVPYRGVRGGVGAGGGGTWPLSTSPAANIWAGVGRIEGCR